MGNQRWKRCTTTCGKLSVFVNCGGRHPGWRHPRREFLTPGCGVQRLRRESVINVFAAPNTPQRCLKGGTIHNAIVSSFQDSIANAYPEPRVTLCGFATPLHPGLISAVLSGLNGIPNHRIDCPGKPALVFEHSSVFDAQIVRVVPDGVCTGLCCRCRSIRRDCRSISGPNQNRVLDVSKSPNPNC